MVVSRQRRSMFCCCSFLTGWNLLPVPTAEKNFEDVANMHVLVQSSAAWISPPPATISACHADWTECDRFSISDQMMCHNRLSGSRLLSSSGVTVFIDLLTAFNALSQWTSLTTYGIRHRPTGFHWRIVVKLGAPAWNVSTRRNGPRPETRRRDVLGRDQDEIRDAQVRDRDRDETLVRLETSRPRPHPCRLHHIVIQQNVVVCDTHFGRWPTVLDKTCWPTFVSHVSAA